MQGQMETELGKIVIDTDVIATYAGSVAVECFGIVGMAAVNMKDGLVKLLKKDYLNPDTYVDDLIAKYDIPPYIYREWSARVREEEGLARKPHCRFGSSPYITPNRYIYRLSKCYGMGVGRSAVIQPS